MIPTRRLEKILNLIRKQDKRKETKIKPKKKMDKTIHPFRKLPIHQKVFPTQNVLDPWMY
jgi:hypothetical protein